MLSHKLPENRRVIVRFDPEDLHAGVHVFDHAGRCLCLAECLDPVGFNDTKAAREHGRVRARYRRTLNRAAKDRERLEDLQDTYGVEPVAAGPGVKPKVVELVQLRQPERNAEAAAGEPRPARTVDRIAGAALRMVRDN